MAKAKVIQTGAACIILVGGDKYKRNEPSENIIKFPGGSISVMRTSNNEYWVHIEVNHGQVIDDTHRESKRGDVIESRIDYDFPGNLDEPHIVPIENQEKINHLAIRIKQS